MDEQFDVWILNARGSTFSRAHSSLQPDSETYWQWTVVEILLFDIKASIEYIKNITGYPKIGYLGMSQGAIVMLGGLALDLGFEKDIEIMVSLAGTALAPTLDSGYLKFMTNPTVLTVLEWLGWQKVMDRPSEFSIKLALAFPSVLKKLLQSRFDFEINNDDHSHLAFYFSRMNGGVSMHSLKFYAELLEQGRFFAKDFGIDKNLLVYGSPSGPSCDF